MCPRYVHPSSRFLSTPSARRATLVIQPFGQTLEDFYPRPPRGGRPLSSNTVYQLPSIFLSTPSARRATRCHIRRAAGIQFLSTPSARRATHGAARRAGGWKFLSTPSARRATLRYERRRAGHQISIHALREEGDSAFLSRKCLFTNFYPRPPRGGRRRSNPRGEETLNFYPRPPRGGRQEPVEVPDISKIFLSTPSARRATMVTASSPAFISISIHALREEGDVTEFFQAALDVLFLSTPSARRATIPGGATRRKPLYFYPRPPRGGRRKS